LSSIRGLPLDPNQAATTTDCSPTVKTAFSFLLQSLCQPLFGILLFEFFIGDVLGHPKNAMQQHFCQFAAAAPRLIIPFHWR